MLIAKDASHISRIMKDRANLLHAADMDGWCMATSDRRINTCDPQGAMLVHFLGVAAELQRVFASQQTKAALASAKARGVVVVGAAPCPVRVSPGGSPCCTRRATARQTITDTLNAEERTTATGLPWTARLVTKALTVTQ